MLLLGGCDELPIFDRGVCTAHVQRGLEIRVEDAVTGAPVADGAVGSARDGDFLDLLDVVGWDSTHVATTLGGAEERPGVYRVVIDRPGYARWDTTGVRVADAECHVRPARFTARLQPL